MACDYEKLTREIEENLNDLWLFFQFPNSEFYQFLNRL